MQRVQDNGVNRDTVRLVVAAGALDPVLDNIIEFDCTAGAIPFTLPLAAACRGWRYIFTKIDPTANAATIAAAAGESINGQPTYVLSRFPSTITMESDGVGWGLVSFYSPLVDPNNSSAFVGVPTGAIFSYGGQLGAPSGWAFCDGSSQLRTGTFGALFLVIGTQFGTVDATHFNLPDFRGRFLRGVDGVAGRDPGSAARTAMNAGGNVGNNIGSVQPGATALPVIPFTVPGGTTDGAGAFADNATANDGTNVPVNAGGDAETRPLNAYIQYIIKL